MVCTMILTTLEMAGYDGIETLAFNVLSRIFSQADLDISVTLDDVNQPTEPEGTYNIHAAESRAQGLQQAKVRTRCTNE